MARHRTHNRQRGITLLLTLLALLLISVVGAAILYIAASESGFVGSQRKSARAFYAAEAGLEEARYRLMPALWPQGTPPVGLNYSDVVNLTGPGGLPIIPCTNTELAGTMVPCNTITVNLYPTRPAQVLYIINDTNLAAPGCTPNTPASRGNDPFVCVELPGAITSTVQSIQPGVGTNTSVPWVWTRINLKTERASEQDLNLDGTTNDDEPIFSYQGRQYRRPDLLAMDPLGTLFPPPWGPVPPANTGRNCVAAICAQPVYELTSFSNIPGQFNTGHLVRTEIGGGTGFSVGAGILSEPGITINGGSTYIGYDQCDPDCPANAPGPPGPAYAAPAPGVIPSCSYVIPVQSAAAGGTSKLTNNSADSYPYPPPLPDCPAGPGVQCKTCTSNGCIVDSSPFPYDVATIISMLRGAATPVQAGNYQSLPAGGVSIGKFPPGPYPASLIQGTGADPQITYINGPFKCTSGCKGAGILMVDCPTCDASHPALTMDASMEFYGLIIVNGPVSILGGGNPATGCNIYGSLIASGTISNTLGGTMCYRYNSCAQQNVFRNRPFGMMAFREIPQ